MSQQRPSEGPTEAQALQAVRTLLAYIGEDPDRPGLRETPQRVVRAFHDEYARGYAQDPVALLDRTFDEVGGYDEPILLKDIHFTSHCEHHLAPIVGLAHVAYLPDRRVVGISKLARVVDAFAGRLQIQERMTTQIAEAIDVGLRPRGVAVIVEATHHCMTGRGVRKPTARMVTQQFLGAYREDRRLRRALFEALELRGR